jgi:hypothetical protein
MGRKTRAWMSNIGVTAGHGEFGFSPAKHYDIGFK